MDTLQDKIIAHTNRLWALFADARNALRERAKLERRTFDAEQTRLDYETRDALNTILDGVRCLEVELEMAKRFHDVAVAERDHARAEIARLELAVWGKK